MTIEANPIRIENQDFNEQPTLTPLREFHGRIVNPFSSLPEEGKVFEVIKRVLCLIGCLLVAPIAYPILALVDLMMGSRNGTRPTPEGRPPESSKEHQDRVKTLTERMVTEINRITRENTEEERRHLAEIDLHRCEIKKIKCVFNCVIGDKKFLHEINSNTGEHESAIFAKTRDQATRIASNVNALFVQELENSSRDLSMQIKMHAFLGLDNGFIGLNEYNIQHDDRGESYCEAFRSYVTKKPFGNTFSNHLDNIDFPTPSPQLNSDGRVNQQRRPNGGFDLDADSFFSVRLLDQINTDETAHIYMRTLFS